MMRGQGVTPHTVGKTLLMPGIIGIGTRTRATRNSKLRTSDDYQGAVVFR